MLNLLKEVYENETCVRLGTLIILLNQEGRVRNFLLPPYEGKGIYISRLLGEEHISTLVISYVYKNNTYCIYCVCDGKEHQDPISYDDIIKIIRMDTMECEFPTGRIF